METARSHVALGRAEELQSVASSALVPMRVTAAGGAAFEARVESAAAGPLAVARIRSSPHLVSRDARSITSGDPDLLMVTLHRRGTATVAQGDRRHRVAPGSLVAFDTARTYSLDVPGACDVVATGLPRTLLGPYAELVARRTALPLPAGSGTGAVVAAFLAGLGAHLGEMPATSRGHLGDALVSLLVAAFTEATPERAEVATPLVDRIVAYVRANLMNPDLCVESVARRHGISPRHLHQLFRGQDVTFAAWVRRERLTRVRRDLLDPALAHRTAAGIAATWGILGPDHLGRMLRAEFGLTAAEIRSGAEAGGHRGRRVSGSCAGQNRP
ncbi:helix-turn-helix domain-containing protein [Streptomyces sp. NBC_01520]|uniref:AraC-like ligand-binding domain-containing protein n=1 Tax=Streptomyces sp. NBC_01520 TaxID=2903892 RepID=UPI00386E32BD